MSRLRVINLGLPKSGTTTLARALRRSGLKTTDYRVLPRQTDDPDLHGAFLGQVLYDGYFQTGDPLYALNEFDAFTELNVLTADQSLWPQTDWGFIAAIRAHHPGAKFLLSYRDPRKLSASMLRWNNLGTDRLPNGAIPGMPVGYGETTLERITWIKGHYAHLRQLFAGAEDFLEYDLDDTEAPTQIGTFLGRDLPWWGRANSNPEDRDLISTESAIKASLPPHKPNSPNSPNSKETA